MAPPSLAPALRPPSPPPLLSRWRGPHDAVSIHLPAPLWELPPSLLLPQRRSPYLSIAPPLASSLSEALSLPPSVSGSLCLLMSFKSSSLCRPCPPQTLVCPQTLQLLNWVYLHSCACLPPTKPASHPQATCKQGLRPTYLCVLRA